MLERCLTSLLARTRYGNFEVLLLIKSLGQLSAGLKKLESSLSSSSRSNAKQRLKSAEALLAKSDRSERQAEKLIGAKIS